MNTVVKGLRENASKLEVQLFNTDAFIVTVGDRVSRILRVDKAGEACDHGVQADIYDKGGNTFRKSSLVSECVSERCPELRQTVLEGIRRSGRFMASGNEVAELKQRMSSRLEEHFASERARPNIGWRE